MGNPSPFLKALWKWHGPERIRLFLWKLGNSGLLTNADRRRHLSDSDECVQCSNQVEDVYHIFGFCPAAYKFWEEINIMSNFPDFFFLNFYDWMLAHIKSDVMIKGRRWSLLFVILLDNLWRNKNDVIFNNMHLSAKEIILRALNQVKITSVN